MAKTSTIMEQELYITSILSVVQRQYKKGIYIPPDIFIRKEDLLVCVIEGESIYHFDSCDIHLHAGDVIFLPRGCRYHRTIMCDHYQTILIYFHFAEIPNVQLSPGCFSAIQGIAFDFLKLSGVWNSGGLGAQSLCMSLLYGIYVRLLQSGSSVYLPSRKQELFEAAVQKLTEQYTCEDFSVTALAEQAEMSEVHFRRCFKQIYHVSPQQYLIELRLTKARELLQYDTTPVAEVALVSGFSDACYFSRLFKKKTGYSPFEYRVKFGTPHPD